MQKIARTFRKWFGREPEAPGAKEILARRLAVAERYLKGEGIEIGPLHMPQPLPAGCRVRFVDRLPVDELRRQYPELAHLPLQAPDIVDDGEQLATIADASQDFVVACHFLEHCENPIGAVRNMMRVVRPGGYLFVAIPEKTATFDRDRPETTLEHLARDDAEGPEWSRRAAYEEWMRFIHKAQDPAAIASEAEKLMARSYSIHFHVWTERGFQEFIEYLAAKARLSFEAVYFARHEAEVVAVLRKQ